MKRRLRIFLLLALLAAVAGGVTLFVPAAPPGEQFVTIERGTSTPAIGRKLADAGVLRFAWQYSLLRALQPSRRVQAGEYRFARTATPFEVLDRLVRGDVYYYELRVPEGYNIFDIAETIEESRLIGRENFLTAARDPALIRDLSPGAPSLEGFLFPSTYRITRATTARELCGLMVAQFRREWRAAGGTGDPLATVTLASLVEKETSIPGERALVAGVYAHRLAVGMKLDADPSTAYAAQLLGVWRGTIYRSDLDREHPYNTYRTMGLPPGPIANPGAAALRASLHPAETEMLFFVARPDGSGGHTFSKDAQAHERAVAAYRRGQQRKAPAAP